jgi:ABC-type transport system substrate-binding protein
MRVEVVAIRPPLGLHGPGLRNPRYLVTLLRELGYRSSLNVFRELATYNAWAVRDSRQRAYIVWGAGGLGTATSSDFLRSFRCGSFSPFRFCDRGIDARIRRASRIQASDPLRANALWEEIDRGLVDRAVVVPLTNDRKVILVSKRVGNYQYHPHLGTLFDQFWVK